jgi:lipase maturation factor
MDFAYFSEHGYYLTRLCFQRGLAFIYLIGFLNILNQWPALLGSKGLLPAAKVIKNNTFFRNPSLFYINSSDRMCFGLATLGLILSLFAILGWSEDFGLLVSMLTWLILWAIYLSFVNVGQIWYSFGWESMLLEVGFLAIFLGPRDIEPSLIVIWLLRWVLFRNMFGAGMIKMRSDPCWRDLTCLYYYYETQPMPNPFSIYFHHLPKIIHRFCVLFNHFAELIVPFFYFAPSTMALIAGLITMIFQLSLIISGNLSFLNYLTIVMSIACLNDTFLKKIFWLKEPTLKEISLPQSVLIYGLLALILYLSIRPLKNLLSPYQIMNTSFDRCHLVNTYGAFGSIGRVREEIIIEGTLDNEINENTQWLCYEFRGKPGRLDKIPKIIAPYHLRLDWLMWFAAMGSYQYYPFIIVLARHLLQADKRVLSLLEHDPFNGVAPKFLRMTSYQYNFEALGRKNIWRRENPHVYLPVVFINKHGQLETITR